MPDRESILESVRTVVGATISAQAAAVDSEARWPEAGLRGLQAAGLGGLVVSREAGGLGQGPRTLVEVCETIGEACASTALCFGMHCVGTAVLAAKATPDQQRRYLEPICAGRHLTTLALSEPGTGVHFYFPETTLERADDGYIVNGTKSFVTNGGHADSYVVSTVAADPQAPPGHFSCVVVPATASGLSWGEEWGGLGMRGNSSRTARLRQVRVAEADRLGQEGDQIWYVFQVVAPYFLAAMAGTYLGVASAALSRARRWLEDRQHTHNDRPLAASPLLQHRFGEIWSTVARTRQLVHYAADQVERGADDAMPAICSAKAEVAECAVSVVNQVMTLMGGVAYRRDSELDRLLRDARASHVMAPTTDLLRLWTGRALLGQPLLED